MKTPYILFVITNVNISNGKEKQEERLSVCEYRIIKSIVLKKLLIENNVKRSRIAFKLTIHN